MLAAGLISGLLGSATIANADSTNVAAVQTSPLESLTTPVGLTAVTLGVIGMVVGMLRKKKIHPENQRKS